MNEAGRRRIEYIDGLRAIAVLGVLFYHAHASFRIAGHIHTYSLPDALIDEGRHGVDLFFVISGFCLSYPVLNRLAAGKDAAFSTPLFFAKRLFRIVPPYWSAALFFVLLGAAMALIGQPLPDAMQAHTWPDLLGQFFFLDRDERFSNGSFWTLAVEARWYLLFPLIITLWIQWRRLFWLVAATCFLLYHLTTAKALDFALLPAFMLGIVAADIAYSPRTVCTSGPCSVAFGCCVRICIRPRASGRCVLLAIRFLPVPRCCGRSTLATVDAILARPHVYRSRFVQRLPLPRARRADGH